MTVLAAPDQDRLWSQLMRLAELLEPQQPGWTRRVFSEPYQASRSLVLELMEEAGLATRTDAAGNLIGELPGAEELPPLVIGSHTDTVAGGGRFDGMVGVVGAIEVARLLRALGEPLRHPLRVVDFIGEEPNRFGLSCLGSRAVTGHLGAEHLALSDGGDTLGEALRQLGADPDQLATALWDRGRFHVYLELHIEQGRVLELAQRTLGVVTAIAGISRANLQLQGRPDHAGTTPMDQRRDALAAAAEVVLGLERLAGQEPPAPSGGAVAVATVGRLEVDPGAANVVPGGARLQVELRSTDPIWLEAKRAQLEALTREVAERRQIAWELEWVSREPPVACSRSVRQLLLAALRGAGHDPIELPSGASHDAAHLARLGPMGMIFIPSRDGRSHCPEEWSDPEQVALGVAALGTAVLACDISSELS